MTTKPLRISSRHGGQHLRIVVDRPKGNVITREVIAALRASLADIRDEAGVKLVTIEGAGDHFSFGASVEEHLPDQIALVLPELHGLVRDLLAAPAPTGAIVRGLCLGGGFEIALACDFVFAADTARFGVPEIMLGVFPPVAAVLLPHMGAAALAARLVLSGETVDAALLERFGLLAARTPTGAAGAVVDAWIEQHLLPRSATSLRCAHRALRASLLAHYRARIGAAERLYLDELMATHDANEGIAAFMEKRTAVWTHA